MINPLSKSTLIIFVKSPIEGEVKTRVGKEVGDDIATSLYIKLLKHTFSEVLNLNSFNIEVHTNKDSPQLRYVLPRELGDLHIQKHGNLGDKMSFAFKTAFEQGASKVVLIGSDCLDITSSILQKAFDYLEGVDVVINPVHDGGYCLIGMRKHLPEVFEGINWSTSSVLADTKSKLDSSSSQYSILPSLSDIDYWEDVPDELKALYK